MYSYEARIRAVERYVKLGKCTGAPLCQLGYRLAAAVVQEQGCAGPACTTGQLDCLAP